MKKLSLFPDIFIGAIGVLCLAMWSALMSVADDTSHQMVSPMGISIWIIGAITGVFGLLRCINNKIRPL